MQLKNLPPEGFTIPVVVKLRERDSTVFSMDCNQSSCGVPSFKTQKTPVSRQTTYHYDLYVNGTKLDEYEFRSDPNTLKCEASNTNPFVGEPITISVTTSKPKTVLTANGSTTTFSSNGTKEVTFTSSGTKPISVSDGYLTTNCNVTAKKSDVSCSATTVTANTPTTLTVTSSYKTFDSYPSITSSTTGLTCTPQSGRYSTTLKYSCDTPNKVGSKVNRYTPGNPNSAYYNAPSWCEVATTQPANLKGSCTITSTHYADASTTVDMSFTPTNFATGASYTGLTIKRDGSCSSGGTVVNSNVGTVNSSGAKSYTAGSSQLSAIDYTYRLCQSSNEVAICEMTVQPKRASITSVNFGTVCYDESINYMRGTTTASATITNLNNFTGTVSFAGNTCELSNGAIINNGTGYSRTQCSISGNTLTYSSPSVIRGNSGKSGGSLTVTLTGNCTTCSKSQSYEGYTPSQTVPNNSYSCKTTSEGGGGYVCSANNSNYCTCSCGRVNNGTAWAVENKQVNVGTRFECTHFPTATTTQSLFITITSIDITYGTSTVPGTGCKW